MTLCNSVYFRLNCDSPANDDGVRTPRGRGKRGRNAVTPPVIDLGERRLRKRRTNNNNPYAAPPSPAKSEVANGKKRGRPADLDLDLDNIRTSKRSRTTKNAAQNGTNSATPENGFIECPEPNCMKKYRHINGLKYHQAHAHKNYEDTEDNADEKVDAKSPVDDPESNTKDVPPSPSGKGRAGRKISSSTTTTQVDQANSGDAKAENSAPATGKSKKSKKEEKADNKENKKQLDKQATVALTPVSLDSSKTGASVFTSTISSLSTITTVSVLPSTAGTQTTTTATTSTAKLPITTPATATEKPKKVKGEKGDKKGKHRAVVPAPVVLSASTPATASSSHAQISIAANPIQTGGLKPIQPKPTVLGEPASVNPLVGLKEKKVKKKKNKDKDKEREKSKSSDKSSESKSGSVKDVKPELSVLVKSEPSGTLSMGLGGSKPLEALAKMSASPPELQKQGISQLSSIVEKSTVSPPELQKQPPALAKVNSPVKVTESVNTRPPSSLSLNSPVASNADGKDSTNANAQSPAYSDISDANDSSCTVEAEVVEVKKERPPTPEPVKAKATGGDRPSSRGYPGSSVYGGFYPPQAFESPTAGSPQPGKDTQKVPAQMPPSKDSEKPSKPTEPTPVKVERKEEVKEEMGHSPKPNPSPAQMREYQERMMHAQQQMAQYQQYMGAYGYGVDMRAMASNPEYKAQYEWGMMEQERLRREYVAMGKGPDGKGKPGDMSRPLDLNTKAMDLSKQGKMSPAGKPTTVTSNELHSNKPGDSDHSKSKEGMNFPPGELRKDQANCDSLKDMDGKNPPLDGRGPQYPPGFERHQEEYRRYFMYQQQRLMEHKRYMEQQGGKEGDRKPPHPLNRDNPGPHPLNREQNGPHPLNREQIGPHPLNREQIGPHPLNREQNGPHPLNREQNGPHPHHREKTGPHPLNRDQPGPHQLNRDQPGQHVPSPHGHHGQPQHAQSPHAPSPHGQPPHGQLPRGQPMPHSHSPHGQAPHGRDQQHAAGRDPHSRDSQMPRDQSGQRTENQSPYNKGHPHHREHDSRPNSGHPHHDPRANSEHKSDKDKSKSGGKLSSSLPASPAGKPKEQRDPAQNAYGQHGQQFYPQGYPGYTGHVPFDPSHAMYQQNPALGYAASPNNYPQYAGPHMRGNHPENFKDGGKAGTLSPSGRGSQDGKALELLQKAANYHNSHSPHAPHPKLKDMKDGMRPDKGSLPSPVKDGDRPESRGSNVSTGKDKERKSPPTLRHVHTHHHTHTVGPAYSLYGPYGSSC